ncbi:hypothetical protein Nmel_001124, partial [Mimus melanotis]
VWEVRSKKLWEQLNTGCSLGRGALCPRAVPALELCALPCKHCAVPAGRRCVKPAQVASIKSAEGFSCSSQLSDDEL